MFIKFGANTIHYYKGIQEKAGPYLHKEAFEVIQPYLKPDFHILELGCGEGAFAQRLTDNGYKVDTCDIVVDQIRAHPNNIIKLDLNNSNLKNNFNCKYDCVVAMEIIEHLENPWKFMLDISELLNDEGIVLITTPNVANFLSRLRFFMRGNLLGFEKDNLSYGHITPITPFQLENLFDKSGFKILKQKAISSIPVFHFYNFSRFSLLRNTVLPLLIPFMGGEKYGYCLAFVLQKRRN